jgi:hypothetical protein
MRVVALLPILALVACSAAGTDDGSPVTGDPTPSTTSTTELTVPDVPDASSEFGLPERVVVTVTIAGDDAEGATFDVAPGRTEPSAVGLEADFASCWAVEGPDWLPAEVLAVAADGSSIRIVESSVVSRNRTVPAELPDSPDGVDVTVTLIRPDGRPILADGRLLTGADLREGRVEAVTEDGDSLVADFACEGDPAPPSDTATVEVSLRLVSDRAGVETIRTFSLRAEESTVCRSGAEDAGTLLEVTDARWTAGGLTGIRVTADGSVTAIVLGQELVAGDARLDGASRMGVLSAVTADGARLDGAWTCQVGG